MATKAQGKTASKSRSNGRNRTPAQIKAYNDFIDKVTCDEIFRELVTQDPKGVLARYDLASDDLQAIKSAPAWAWLRALWKAPKDW
ncbi:MAG: hypothetical protein FJ320_08205 [SAR202 cluster bacterium]|nr:hypothetical protein [SAR202 cluster bacterium]